jgi:hypothetical protein
MSDLLPDDFLPDAVRQGLEAARQASLRRSNRLCIHVGDSVHRVLRLWDGGFALAASDAAPPRGYVDLYDGPRHLASCLVVALPDEEPGGDPGIERRYEFKVHIPVADRPAADFEQPDQVPAALIPPRF